jgi:hypothetical protein
VRVSPFGTDTQEDPAERAATGSKIAAAKAAAEVALMYKS